MVRDIPVPTDHPLKDKCRGEDTHYLNERFSLPCSTGESGHDSKADQLWSEHMDDYDEKHLQSRSCDQVVNRPDHIGTL